MTEGQGKSSIAPTFSKQGYKYIWVLLFLMNIPFIKFKDLSIAILDRMESVSDACTQTDAHMDSPKTICPSTSLKLGVWGIKMDNTKRILQTTLSNTGKQNLFCLSNTS